MLTQLSIRSASLMVAPPAEWHPRTLGAHRKSLGEQGDFGGEAQSSYPSDSAISGNCHLQLLKQGGRPRPNPALEVIAADLPGALVGGVGFQAT